MPERDGYIPGVPCWVDASEPDPQAAADFYGGLFGWEFRDVMPASAEGSYFIARTETRGWSLFDMSGEPRSGNVAAITSMPDGAAPQPRWNTYIAVASADEAATKVRDAGGGVVVEPFDFVDAGRTAVFTDTEGAAFCVWEAKKHNGAQVVNDPGSLNFNGLNTRDIEAAKAFYGSVFGWRTFGVGEAEMWALDGYGDFIESHHSNLREWWAEAGAPPGFEDVVATINRTADTHSDTPAHWSVTFAVEDANAAAAKATELGRSGARPAVRRTLGPYDDPRRPAGRDLRREQVHAGEQGSRRLARWASDSAAAVRDVR